MRTSRYEDLMDERSALRRWTDAVENFMRPKCPANDGGKLKYDFSDPKFDAEVYKCNKCNKLFI